MPGSQNEVQVLFVFFHARSSVSSVRDSNKKNGSPAEEFPEIRIYYAISQITPSHRRFRLDFVCHTLKIKIKVLKLGSKLPKIHHTEDNR